MAEVISLLDSDDEVAVLPSVHVPARSVLPLNTSSPLAAPCGLTSSLRSLRRQTHPLRSLAAGQGS